MFITLFLLFRASKPFVNLSLSHSLSLSLSFSLSLCPMLVLHVYIKCCKTNLDFHLVMSRHLLPHSGNNLRNGFRNGRLANIAGSNGLPLLSATEAGKVTNKTKTNKFVSRYSWTSFE